MNQTEDQEALDLFGTEAAPEPVVNTVPMITEKQLSFINSLLVRKGAGDPSKADFSKVTRKDASAYIDHLMSLPDKPKEEDWGPAGGALKDKPSILGATPDKGTFTVVFKDGERRTIRFQKGRTGHFAGRVVVKYMYGPDNDADYKAIGHGVPGGVKVWYNYRDEKHSRIREAIEYLLNTDSEGRMKAGETYALASSNCWNCGRTLTVPASIHRGVGPDCAKQLGL